MIKQYLLKIISILAVSLFISLFPVSNIIAEEFQTVDEVDELDEIILPTGWINSIAADSMIIDDTFYIVTEKTRFQSAKRKFQEGVFVEFELGIDNFITSISISEPSLEDMDMKPIARSNSKEKKKKTTTKKGEPYLKDGRWVN